MEQHPFQCGGIRNAGCLPGGVLVNSFFPNTGFYGREGPRGQRKTRLAAGSSCAAARQLRRWRR
ncbi:MAG: hypothetical protein REJ50_23385, partial [Bordetella sp.]|nr:hypothetical protein [Bordetella sp.]